MVHTCIEQSRGQLRLPKASVEAIDKFIQVFLQILAGDPMVSPQQERLEVANGDVHPGQPFIYLFRRRNTAFMLLGFSQNTQRHQAIRAGSLPGEQVTLSELPDIPGGYRRGCFHGDETRLLIPAFNGHQDRRFSFCTASAFASGSASAYEGLQPARHHPTQPGHPSDKYCPGQPWRDASCAASGGWNPGDPNLLGQAQGGQAPFVADHQIDGQKPLHQRQIGGMKERAGRHGGLAPTVIALVDLAGRYPVSLVVPAMRALKTIGPALLFQRFGACLLCIKPRLPLQQIHGFRFHLRTSNCRLTWNLAVNDENSSEA